MGILCCKKASKSSNAIDTEKDISVPSYTSKNDKDFLKLETTYNLLRDININDYMYSLSHFSLETATQSDNYSPNPETYSKNDPFFNEPISSDLFQSFIENKMFKHPNLYTKVGNNEVLASICKDCLLEIYRSLRMKLQQSDELDGLQKEDERIKKYHLIALGILYCSGRNVSKVRLIHDLFKENNNFTNSKELKDFLLALFLIPSYCTLSARNKIGKMNKEIGELGNEKMKLILDTCELKDSKNLVQVTEKKIFENSNLNIENFKRLFSDKENGIGYLLTCKGIRNTLEKNNV